MFTHHRLFAIFQVVFLVTFAATAASVRAAPVGMPLDDGPDPYGKAVARLVRSIAEFSRWPNEGRTLRLCIASPADHASELSDFDLSRDRNVVVVRGNFESLRSGKCDMIYLGRHSLEQQRQMVASLQGKPVLTIAENDPACRSRAMFCLLFAADTLSFRLNLDTVSRSGVRIDPRVLRLSKPSGAGAQ